MTFDIKRKRFVLAIIVLVALFVFTQGSFISPVSANLAESPEFMEYMEHIAEDIEEIHEDMHVVAYNIRWLAYSNIAIAVFLLIGVIGLFRRK